MILNKDISQIEIELELTLFNDEQEFSDFIEDLLNDLGSSIYKLNPSCRYVQLQINFTSNESITNINYLYPYKADIILLNKIFRDSKLQNYL